jgi:hypothetical protein
MVLSLGLTDLGPPKFHAKHSALLFVRIFENREDFGLRWQSTAATPLFDCGQSFQSGVALRFPPQSKKLDCGFAPSR